MKKPPLDAYPDAWLPKTSSADQSPQPRTGGFARRGGRADPELTLRTRLYHLEFETRHLKDEIPDKAPTGIAQEKLRDKARSLAEFTADLGHSVENIGADIRLNDVETGQVEFLLTYGLTQKSLTLTHIEEVIVDGPWDAADIRSRLTTGIKAVHDAQVAVGEFYKKLEAAGEKTEKAESTPT